MVRKTSLDNMINGQFNRVFVKLDDVSEKLNEIAETTAKQEQHLKGINGTLVRHETQFKDLYEKTDANTNDISMAKGGIFGVKIGFAAVGLVVTILSAAAITKSLGFW